jgi:hypothetical protein
MDFSKLIRYKMLPIDCLPSLINYGGFSGWLVEVGEDMPTENYLSYVAFTIFFTTG